MLTYIFSGIETPKRLSPLCIIITTPSTSFKRADERIESSIFIVTVCSIVQSYLCISKKAIKSQLISGCHFSGWPVRRFTTYPLLLNVAAITCSKLSLPQIQLLFIFNMPFRLFKIQGAKARIKSLKFTYSPVR